MSPSMLASSESPFQRRGFPTEMRIPRRDLYGSQSSSYILRPARYYLAWRSCEINHRSVWPALLACRGECSCRRPPKRFKRLDAKGQLRRNRLVAVNVLFLLREIVRVSFHIDRDFRF